jgi:hypothetical protein
MQRWLLLLKREIRKHNRAFEKVKTEGRSLPEDSVKWKDRLPAINQMLYAVLIERLHLQVMNPLQNNALNDIVAVHGFRAIPNMTWKERISGMNWFSHETMLPNAASQALIPRFEYD